MNRSQPKGNRQSRPLPHTPSVGPTIRKRQRPLVWDSSDERSSPTPETAPEKKATSAGRCKYTQRPRRASIYAPDSEFKSRNVTTSPTSPRKTRTTSRLEPGVKHSDFFTLPKNWHVKNPNPRMYRVSDLLDIDITRLQYPVEVVRFAITVSTRVRSDNSSGPIGREKPSSITILINYSLCSQSIATRNPVAILNCDLDRSTPKSVWPRRWSFHMAECLQAQSYRGNF